MTPTKKPSHRRAAPALRAVAALSFALGCGGNPTIDPSRIELAGDLEAQAQLSRFRLVWESGEDAERRALEPELLAYVERYGSDPTARQISVMAAVLLVERVELERSSRLVRVAEIGPAGPTRDMANVVLGAVDRRRGRPVRALDGRSLVPIRAATQPIPAAPRVHLGRAQGRRVHGRQRLPDR